MIFASDLDQTLIYSKNFLNKHYDNAQTAVKQLSIIEYYRGEPLSYIHNKLISQLKALDNKGLFIPVTTRTEEQYKRIDFSRFGINPKYAVTTNGAKVLINGVADKNRWEYIQSKLKQVTPQPDDIEALIRKTISAGVIKKIRVAEDAFTYCVLFREHLNLNQVQELSTSFTDNGWNLSLQGNKLYFMPSILSKAEAMRYICQKLNLDHYMAAGDSLLDLPLLAEAKEGFIPMHGEIYEQKLHLKHRLNISEFKGIDASLSIIQSVAKRLLVD